jgi:scyllo-inositol 2-dehydrogenase (NADP+)
VTDTPIRVAIVGYGLAGAVFHGPLVASTPGMIVASVITTDPHRQERARAEHPGVMILDRVEALFEKADEHDVVVIATPNRWHVPIGLMALDAGLPVVIDKPLAATAASSAMEHSDP